MSDLVDPASVGMGANRLERIGPAMQSYVDRGVVRGISTLVARRGQVVHGGLYGQRDAESGAKMTDDTIFRIYSMTKPIVSTLRVASAKPPRTGAETRCTSIFRILWRMDVPRGSLH